MGGSPVQASLVESSPELAAQRLTRTARLCREAVDSFRLDLQGMRVLTEAATGPYAVTAVLAALAGAEEVIAVTRSSRWGEAADAIAEVQALAAACGGANIRFERRRPSEVAAGCDLVTNTGFVRPIDAALIGALAPTAAIALMWEPWEFRPEDMDLAALARCGIALVGTNEAHPLIRTLDYLGPSAARLLLEVGIEIVGARLLIVGSDPFGAALRNWFERAGACLCSSACDHVDAVVFAEHRSTTRLFNGDSEILARLRSTGAPIVRICGNLDVEAIRSARVAFVPSTSVPHGVMAITTAYAGPRPVVDLHAGGFRATADVVRARQRGASVAEAVAISERAGFGAACPMPDDSA